MKRSLGLLLALCLAGGPAAVSAASRVPGITSSSRFLVYYGQDYGSTVLTTLKQANIVVLHPTNSAQLTPRVVAELQGAGVKVIAYISVGEDPAPLDAAGNPIPIVGNGQGPVRYTGTSTGYDASKIVAANGGVASFYVDQLWSSSQGQYVSDGQPDVNTTFGGFFIWPNDDWRWVLNEQRIGGVPASSLANRSVAGLKQLAGARTSATDADRTHDFGFDGFFLDTLDTAGPYVNAWGYYAWAAPEMQKTVKFIYDSYPGKIVFANRGTFFFNPLIANPAYGIRPYQYSLRPYIHAALFESYALDSDPSHTGLSPYLPVNRDNYAQKLMAEANRPDGFTVFSLDYDMGRGATLSAQALQETAVKNGWVEYIAPTGQLDTLGSYVATHPPASDTAAPVWDSTAAFAEVINPPYPDVPDRVGVQRLALTPRPGEVVVQWDVARDQSLPIRYNIYRSTSSTFSNPVKYAQVPFEVGTGWSTDPTTNFANQYTVTGLTPGTHYFRVRAEDSASVVHEDTNTVTLSITVATSVSNPNASITVDGNLSDWATLTSFAVDPQDATAPGDVADWARAWLAHDANNLYLAIQNHVSITQLNAAFSVYLDTDNNRATGFRGGGDQFPLGAEYVLLGTSLYSYQGTGLNWQWNLVGTAGFSWGGLNAELFIPRAWVNNPAVINLFYLGDNPSLGGTTVDAYPDAALQPQGATRSFLYRLQ